MYHVLLVEDDVWLAQLYADTLQADINCIVHVAHTASKALDLLDKHSEIGLIVLDMFLPDHNGVEFLHEMASYSDINHLPVIVLSTIYQHDFAMNEERWKHYGVVQYLFKPDTKPQDLVVAIKKQYVGEVKE